MRNSAAALWLVVLALSQGAALAKTVYVGDARLTIGVTIGDNDLSETCYRVDGQALPDLSGVPWVLDTDLGSVTPVDAALAGSTPDELAFEGATDALNWKLVYRTYGSGLISKSLTITPKRAIVIKHVSLWKGRSSEAPIISSTALQDIAAFYRRGRVGLFASLDFPYAKIAHEDGITQVTYPPYRQLAPGVSYTCHTLTIGATALTGRMRYGFDEGEADAMDSYVQTRFPPRFDRPMFVSASINNRYTMPQGDTIFYTMKDHPTLRYNIDILKREIELLPKLGMEYYQVWPGPFDAVPGDPDPSVVKSIVRLAKRNGVRIGDYSGCTYMFCPHYNEHRNTLENHPEWGINWSDVCYGNPKFARFYADVVVANDKQYGFQIHCLDFLNMQVCNSTEHGHPAGPESIYAQVAGLVDVLTAINNVSPEMMTWSNSGNWSEFLPKMAWWNPNLYLTDPFVASPWQGLNMTRILDDARREQMVSLHYSRFIPYRNLTNCQYFFSQNSIVPDIRNYQYGALSTIAVTPNLCLAEVRPWMDKLPDRQVKEVQAFYKKWTDFLIAHYDLWRKTYQVGENPGTGSVEIYGHCRDDRGYVFLVNPQYWGRTVAIPLDASLGLTASGKCEIAELYPSEKLVLTSQGPLPSYGSSVTTYVPAQQVIVLEIRRAPAKIDKPRLYGVPGSVTASAAGYEIHTTGMQGHTERCAVLLPDGSKPITGAEARTDVPIIPERLYSPTGIAPVASDGTGVAIDITFRRAAAPDELRDWMIRKGGLADGLSSGWTAGFQEPEAIRFPLFADVADPSVTMPMWGETANQLGLGTLASYCGGYIDNAFSEEQETWIRLRTDGPSAFPAGRLASDTAMPYRDLPDVAKDKAGEWWLQTTFHLPFMYTIGAEPPFDEHTILALPFIRRDQIGDVRVWLNGVPLEIRTYAYPRNRALGCYYADLVGTSAFGGNNTLVLYIQAK